MTQALLKPLQAALFGFFMTALCVRANSLWPAVGVHAAFNLLYLGPDFLRGVIQQTYLSGVAADLAVFAFTLLLFVPLAFAAYRLLRAALWDKIP